MSAQQNMSLARNLYHAFNDGNVERALELAADDIVVELVAFGMVFRGPQGFRNFMQGFKTAFPDLTVTVTNQVATDDQVVNECTWRGTHTGPLQTPTGELPATNRTVEDGRFCEVWAMRDGKIVSLHNYQDAASWLRQLGLGA